MTQKPDNSVETALQLAQEALVQCLDCTETATEMGSSISIEGSQLVEKLAKMVQEAEEAESETLPAQPVSEILVELNNIVLQSASLGALTGTFHDVTEKITSVVSFLQKSGANTEEFPGHLLTEDNLTVARIATRPDHMHDWTEHSLEEFMALPLMTRARILTKEENRFYTQEGKEIPPLKAIYGLRNSMLQHKAPGAELSLIASGDAPKQLHILLVDDDNFVRTAIEKKISREFKRSIALTTASDGREALQILQGTHPDKTVLTPRIVFLDIHMPGMDGIEVLSTIRKDPALKDTVVFILSATVEERMEVKAYALGCAGFLKKKNIGEEMSTIIGLVKLYRQTSPAPKQNSEN